MYSNKNKNVVGTNVKTETPGRVEVVTENETTSIPTKQNVEEAAEVKVLSSVPSTYQEFTKEAFDKALEEGKIVYLEFYATWCPTCIAQEPGLVEGLQTLADPNIVAFRVNFKDDNTGAYEKELMEKYNVTYQHTKVVLVDGKAVINEQAIWTSEDVVKNLSAL